MFAYPDGRYFPPMLTAKCVIFPGIETPVRDGSQLFLSNFIVVGQFEALGVSKLMYGANPVKQRNRHRGLPFYSGDSFTGVRIRMHVHYIRSVPL